MTMGDALRRPSLFDVERWRFVSLDWHNVMSSNEICACGCGLRLMIQAGHPVSDEEHDKYRGKMPLRRICRRRLGHSLRFLPPRLQ